VIQLVPQLKILVCIEPQDLRKGIDSLAAVCRQHLDADLFSGALFVLRNRAATSVRMLVYDGDGFWLCTKRLSRGKLAWWPSVDDSTPLCSLAARQLQVLLNNGNPSSADFAPEWRRLP
jgi:transposase